MISSINHSILTQVLRALKDGNIRHCESLGFTHSELNQLNQLTMDELFCLSRSAAQFMSVTVQHEVLRKMLAQAKQEIFLQQRIEKAISLGGSIELLNKFFGMSSNEISARRRLMGIHIPQGRTQIPNEADDAKIWEYWQHSRPDKIYSLDALDKMIEIVEKVSSEDNPISLTVVWNRIVIWEKEETNDG
ncbi:DUF2857 domain-containing protein [Hafnia paralvei]|uniref:DUF2857 domain-containing protein n=1 Tax=Hafnia paralvei TaxID=546367 RepID=UPI0020329540|nr:DUF2857 domain-containing protein [Hafnia paralvei]